MEYLITVFTPTYNRAHTLHRVYKSLRQQTYKDFEWLIIDDGSIDGTNSLVREWQAQADFPIKYLWQENQGKHIAINRGVQEAKGELFAIFDSDDACIDTAFERIALYWQSISHTDRKGFAGIATQCVDQYGKEVSPKLPADVFDASWVDINYKYGIGGERWGIFRTDILQKYPFPTDLKKQYFPEGIIWLRIGKLYKTRFINEALRVYYIEGPSMVNGVRSSKNAMGGYYEHSDKLNTYIAYIKHSPWVFLKSAIHYSRFSFHLHRGLHEQLRSLQNRLAKTLWILTVLIGLTVYLKDVLRERK